jgi:hypothetical protein
MKVEEFQTWTRSQIDKWLEENPQGTCRGADDATVLNVWGIVRDKYLEKQLKEGKMSIPEYIDAIEEAGLCTKLTTKKESKK